MSAVLFFLLFIIKATKALWVAHPTSRPSFRRRCPAAGSTVGRPKRPSSVNAVAIEAESTGRPNSAGMLAMAYYCASYGGEDDYQEGSERDDLEKIKSLLLRLSSEAQERSAIQEACWKEAQQILSDYWSAVQALAAKLLKHRTLDGRDAHSIIWRTTGYPHADWRFGALNLP